MGLCTATFEAGSNGSTIATTDAGSATAWDTVNGTPVYDNAHAYGSLAAKFNAVGDQLLWTTAFGFQTGHHYGRAYLYATGYPSDLWQLIRNWQGAGVANDVWITSTGKLRVKSVTQDVTGTVSIATNQWVRIEYHVYHEPTSSVGYCEAKLFNTPDSTAEDELVSSGLGNSRTDSNTMRFGLHTGTSAGGPIWLDNIVAGATSYPGPIPGPALALPPVIYGRGAC